MRRMIVIAAAALLAGCAEHIPLTTSPTPAVGTGGFPGAPDGGPEVTYVCEDLTTVVVRPWQHMAVATLNSGLELRLAQHAFGFGDGRYDFRGGGNAGVWKLPDRPPVPCRRKR